MLFLQRLSGEPRLLAILIWFALLALLPLGALAIGEPFYIRLFTKVMIWSLAAVSLDFILGYGGMVSFGHAAYLGLGGYAVAILYFYGIDNAAVQFAVAIAGSALVALLIGLVVLRTSGVYFIMITLAFTQMLFFLGISLEEFGGDDGLRLRRSVIVAKPRAADLEENPVYYYIGKALDLNNKYVFYYFTFVILVVCVFVLARFVNSRFGMVVRGSMSNDQRMQAIGFPTHRYRLAAFVIAGVICGVAGALLANFDKFLTPSVMQWNRSGEILVIVLMGGIGTLYGPMLGAAVFLLLEIFLGDIILWLVVLLGLEHIEWFAELHLHWMLVFGPFLVILVLFARRGIFGLIPERRGSDG